jgi:hypothetical protein
MRSALFWVVAQPEKDMLTDEDRTDGLSRNVGQELPVSAALKPGRTQNLKGLNALAIKPTQVWTLTVK